MAEFLTRAFFEEELDREIEVYRQKIGEREVAVVLMLRDGQALKLEGKPTCTNTYVLADLKAKGAPARAAIPYGSIVAVTLTAESGGTMGFNR